ncbi:MAG: hypothetical protein WCB79_01650 [Halobacteriota archaeon]
MQAIYSETNTDDKKQALYNLSAAYLHTIPLELMESVEQGRRDPQIRYVAIYGAACSYGLGKAQRLDGP